MKLIPPQEYDILIQGLQSKETMRCIGDGRDIWSLAVEQSAVPAPGELGRASGPTPVPSFSFPMT